MNEDRTELTAWLQTRISAEKRFQKHFSGKDHDDLLLVSLGKLMAYDNCLKEIQNIVSPGNKQLMLNRDPKEKHP